MRSTKSGLSLPRLAMAAAVAAGLSLCTIAASAATPGIHDSAAVVTAPAHPTIPVQPASPNADVVLTFEGLGNQEPVMQFYNGGTGGNGSGPGANYGIYFSDNSLAIIDSDAGGSGNFGGEPSPDTILFFLGGSAATMNVPAGFTTGFSFFYSSPFNTGQITVYDGLDGTGNVLATLNLPTTPESGAPDPTGVYSPFVPIGVSFSGTARSVDFGGVIDQIGFDDITLGSSVPGTGPGATLETFPVPLLSRGGLAVLGGLLALLALGAYRGTRRRGN